MTDQELLIKVKADTDKAVKEIKGLTKQVTTLSKRQNTFGKSATSIDKVAKSYQGLSKTIVGVGAALATLGVVDTALDWTKMAENATQASDAFDKVFTDMGANAVEEFDKIKEASRGLIPDSSIKQAAVTAASLGIPISKMAELMEVARAKSREMGTTVESAFADLATGIGRGSPMILDNLGLTIKLGEANKTMADSLGKNVTELTKQEKTLALTNAVINAGSSSVTRFANSTLSSKEKTQQFQAKIKNLKEEIGTKLIPIMDNLKDATIEWIDSLTDEDIKRFTDAIGGLFSGIKAVVNAVKVLNDILLPDWLVGEEGAGAFDTAIQGFTNLADRISTINEMVENMNTADAVVGDIAKLEEAISVFDGTAESYKKLSDESIRLIEETGRLKVAFINNGSAEAKAQIEALNEAQGRLESSIGTLASQRPLDGVTESAKEATDEVTKLGDTDAEVDIKIDADTESYASKMAKSRAEAESKKVVVPVDADTTEADAKIKKTSSPSKSKHTVVADTSAAQKAIDKLKQPTKSEHTVYERVVPATRQAPSTGFATGGYTGPGGKYEPAGIVHKDEFVFNKEATQAIGVGKLYKAMHDKSLKGYSGGGLVGGSSITSQAQTPINLNIGGKSFQVMSDAEVAEALTRHINSEGGL